MTAIAEARWRKRNAVRAVKDALIELRVANRKLAELEGRPIRERPLMSGVGERRRSSLAVEGSACPSTAPCHCDDPARDPAGEYPTPAGVAEGPAGRLPLSSPAGPEEGR